MDLGSLKEQVSNLTLYDVKAGVRKLQNAVMNFTEMEAKVREATNNEPWGASSTLMQEIASGTFNYSLLNEIMPMIYKRFTEKSAEEWRQIYKALQLLEFLIKNGSERVIDDARAHVSLLKILRQFHYIDQNGKDQGINVRNRAKELAELLSDVDKIRTERKKARATRNKYGGLEGGSSLGSMSGGGSRYGGFGNNDLSYGGYSGGVYGDGGGFGGSSGGFHDSGGRRDRFEEYDEGDDASVATSTRATAGTSSSSTGRRDDSSKKKAEPPKPKEPEVDLLSVDDDVVPTSSSSSANMGALQSGGAEDDEFDDFQSATPSTTAPSSTTLASSILPPSMSSSSGALPPPLAAPKPVSGGQGAGLNNLVAFSSVSPAPSTTSTSTYALPASSAPSMSQPGAAAGAAAFQASQPNYFTSVSVASNQPQPASASARSGASLTQPGNASKPVSSSSSSSLTSAMGRGRGGGGGGGGGGDAFGSLWSSASAGANIKKSTGPTQQGPNLASMAKEKASAGIWGAAAAAGSSSSRNQAQTPAQGQSSSTTSTFQKRGSSGLDDLLS